MSATNFKTENNTFRKLLGNGLTYQIPRFQRDYSWSQEEWEDLWMDILEILKENGEQAHYMGYLVLQSDNDKVFNVIDGQQRMTTLSIVILAVLKNLSDLIENNIESDNNTQRLQQIRQTYIGYLDPVTLVSSSKLRLNRNNDTYYQTYLVPTGHLPQRGFRASEHGLRKAFEWFYKKIKEYSKNDSNQGVLLARFVESMSDKLFFTVINVSDELNAYKVFETLNSRGVRLSATDLLKNYLFSILHKEGQHEHEMQSLEIRWEAMVGRLGSENFSDFLRIHWNSRNTLARHAELFKTIRNKVKTRDLAFHLIRQMEEDIDTYMALTQPEASGFSSKLKKYILELKLFGVKQPFSFLFACKRKLSDENFEKTLRYCSIISFRYNIIGNRPPNEQERIYNNAAQMVSQSESTDLQMGAILKSLSGMYLSDEEFKSDFIEKILQTNATKGKRIVRYILCSLERAISGIEHDFESDLFNLEHILPENPNQEWHLFNDDQVEALVFRLGNMTLLNSADNREIGNAGFLVKREKYKESDFKITLKIANENAEWNPSRILAHQNWMAKQATSIWRIDQLS